MPNSPASLSILDPTPFPWSEVRSNDRVMRYRRSGAGAPILLLGATPELPSPLLPPALMDGLGAQFRLILPELHADATPATCLANFLEALGTISVTVLAIGAFCMPAIELACRDMDQIRRLVLVPDGERDDDVQAEALSVTVGRSLIPTLIVRPGLSPTDALAVVTRFVLDA